eukprot:SAG11_NODE_5326_length_1594_cov_5.432107_2_plen_123_part_01
MSPQDDDHSPWSREELLGVFTLGAYCISSHATSFNHTLTVGRAGAPPLRLWLLGACAAQHTSDLFGHRWLTAVAIKKTPEGITLIRSFGTTRSAIRLWRATLVGQARHPLLSCPFRPCPALPC